MRLILSILLLSLCYGTVINVPADYTTIQAGIDAAVDGDIVVVYPDTYYENIVINKTITLTSLALFDPTTNTLVESLDTWFSDDYPIVVSDEYINTTIIDGSQEDSSTVIIAGSSCITPKIQGFTIQGGQGTKMDRFYEDTEGDIVTAQEYLGGGILLYMSNPKVHYNKIKDNNVKKTSVKGE